MLERAYSVRSIKQNIDRILKAIPPEISVMAVIKYANEYDIKELLDDGRIKIIGENRIQDALKRWAENGIFYNYRRNISLHFIGHLQKNKVKFAVRIFNYIDSVDTVELAEEINKRTPCKIPVLLQLKINNSPSQYGIIPDNFEKIYSEISRMENLSVAGIMAIAPNTDDEVEIRRSFRIAKSFYNKYFNFERNKDGFKNYLSIGMSSDWKIAVEEGSNMLRLGTIIFKN